MKRKGDYIVELGDYIKKNLKKGYTKESLKWALVQQGYSKLEVEKAIEQVDKSLASEAPVLDTKPKITYEAQPIAPVVEEKKSFWKRLLGK